MKSVLAVLVAVFLGSCSLMQEPKENKGTAPHVSSLEFATSLSNLSSGVYVYSLIAGTTYYAGFIVDDPDLDAESAEYTVSVSDVPSDPYSIPLPSQPAEVSAYYVVFAPTETGAYTLTLYVKDSEGNESNPLRKFFPVLHPLP